MDFDDASAHADPWRVLRAVLPEDHLQGFMFMGQRGERHDYKHGITRVALTLRERTDGSIVAVERRRSEDRARGSVSYAERELAISEALDLVYADIGRFGASRTSPYDHEYKALRDADLARLGWNARTVDAADGLRGVDAAALARDLGADRGF